MIAKNKIKMIHMRIDSIFAVTAKSIYVLYAEINMINLMILLIMILKIFIVTHTMTYTIYIDLIAKKIYAQCAKKSIQIIN